MSDPIEFGLDNAKIIKAAGCEAFKQSRPNEKSRITIISFRTYHDVKLKEKEAEKGSPLTDAEKADIIAKTNAKIAEHLGKPVDQLTEVDKLNPKEPKFGFSFTHFRDGIGTIKCLSKYEGNNVIKPAICCDKMGDADQTVATVILQYPVDSEGAIDMDLFKQKKYTSVFIWKLGSKKFMKLRSILAEQKEEKRQTIDLRVELDGEVKYQKQNIHFVSSAAWCRDDVPPELKHWVLEQGIKNWKYIKGNLGFEMTVDKLMEKLGQAPQIAEEAAKPQVQAGYTSLLD